MHSPIHVNTMRLYTNLCALYTLTHIHCHCVFVLCCLAFSWSLLPNNLIFLFSVLAHYESHSCIIIIFLCIIYFHRLFISMYNTFMYLSRITISPHKCKRFETYSSIIFNICALFGEWKKIMMQIIHVHFFIINNRYKDVMNYLELFKVTLFLSFSSCLIF